MLWSRAHLPSPWMSRPASALALSSDLRRIAAALDARERDIDLPHVRAQSASEQRCARVGGWCGDAGGAGCGVVVFLGTRLSCQLTADSTAISCSIEALSKLAKLKADS